MSKESVANISEFNADAVLKRLMINPMFERVEASSARFVFDTHVLESEIPRGMGRRKAEIESSIKFMQERLDTLVLYMDDFFAGELYDKDALMLAVLCGSHLHTANEEGFASLDISFDPDADNPRNNVLNRARFLLGKSLELGLAACKTDVQDTKREALFLGHVEAMVHTLPSVKEALDGIKDDASYGDDLREFAENEFLAMELFIDQKTELGKKLASIAGHAYCQTLERLEVLPTGDRAELPKNDNFGQP